MLPTLIFGEIGGVLVLKGNTIKLKYFSYEHLYERIRVRKITNWWLL